MKRFGIICDGGDAPGINAVIRAVSRAAFEKGHEVFGFVDGFEGLIKNDVKIVTKQTVSGILNQGGSVLGISRVNPFGDPKHIGSIKENFKRNSLTLLILIGDRDTVVIAKKLSEEGIPSLVIPKTIDNDVYGTDFTIGFDTAVSTISAALDSLHATASTHHRLMVVETMGRETGWLALFGGIAGGADYIVIPEVPYELSEIAAHIEKRRNEGKNFSIIVVAEGTKLPAEIESKIEKDEFGHPVSGKRMIGYYMASELEKLTNIKARTTVLGYTQRGGVPTTTDRILAIRLGVQAVDLANKGVFNGVVGIKGSEIIFTPLEESASRVHMADTEYLSLAKIFF
ncbi:MAG: 6-phosphofructokinase [Caldisericaceae bacterium]